MGGFKKGERAPLVHGISRRMTAPRALVVALALLLHFCCKDVEISAAVVVTGQRGPHISSLNLLLPPRTTRPVRHRLLGFNGCFTWSWDHHDFLSVEPDYNATVKHCSTSAVLTSIAPYSSRKATAVHATDVFTGLVLRCEVFIDKIYRIRIFHHSLRLDLDGVATLRIQAFDSEDNVFSSLTGLQFMWQLSPVDPSGDILAHRLLHVPLKDTALELGEIGETEIGLEQSGIASDFYVVRGVNAGQERVTAQLMEPLSEDLIDIIVLTVAEAMSLDPPSPIYIIPGTHLQYTLKTLRRNTATVVRLPSPHHHWFLANSSIAEMDSSLGKVVGLTQGETTVVVEDTRVEGHQQTSTLHVVTPVSLRLYLTPLVAKGASASAWTKGPPIMSSDVPWQLVAGRKYVVQVFTFSRESGTRPLQLTKDNDLRRLFANRGVWVVDDVPEDIASEQGWQNCSLLHAIKEGSGTLVVALAHGSMVQSEGTGNWLLANKEVLREEQKVVVCSSVHVTNPQLQSSAVLRLPWAPGHGQHFILFVEGGCGQQAGDYIWSSSNLEIASIDTYGVVSARGLGEALVRVAPARDALNYAEVTVEVSMPVSLDMFPGLSVEVEVPGSLTVAVILRTFKGEEYSQCDAFNSLIQWDISGGEDSFVQINKSGEILPILETETTPCAWSLLLATKAARVTVTAVLSVTDALHETEPFATTQRPLETSWVIAAYVPMWLEQIGDGNSYGGYSFKGGDIEAFPDSTRVPHEGLNEILLVAGSSMRVIVQGGPERWRQGVEFVESIAIGKGGTETSSPVAVTHQTEGGGRLYLLTCNGIGNDTLAFYRGNLAGSDHPARTVASISLSVVCAVPSSIALLIDEPENTLPCIRGAVEADRDANRVRTTPFTVINGRTIRVSAIAMTGERVFANASSMYINWQLNGCDGLAQWQFRDKISDRKSEEGSWERFLELSNGFGECIVEAMLGGVVSGKAMIHDSLFPSVGGLVKAASILKDVAPLQLVSALRLEPRNLLLFLHPHAKASLSVLGGTFDVESHVHDSKVAVLSHSPPAAGLFQLVVGARGMGTTLITVRDVGLATPSEASALVMVTDVAWVKMLIPEDASILLGSKMTIQLEAGNEAGYVFDPSQFQFLNVKIRTQDDIIEVLRTPKSAILEVDATSIVIRGASVGLTSTLHVSVQRHSGQEILSDFGRVAVFAPLAVHPPSLVIAPGAQYVLRAEGGPRVGATVEFSSSDLGIASIDRSAGRLKAISPGNLTIYAKARSSTGLIITEDAVEVRVQANFVPILNVRGGELGVNREMSIFPMGKEEDLLSFGELCADYKWSIADEEVLFLRPAESVAGRINRGGPGKGLNPVSDRQMPSSSHVYGYDGVIGSEEGFSARVVGRSAGRTKVTVSFTCHFANGDGNIEPKSYTASDTVSVVPPPPLALGIPATLQLRPQYTSSNLLPQWTGQTLSRTDTGDIGKKSVLYTVMQEGCGESGVISITNDGRIRTTERLDDACIHARDLSTGRAEVAACVRVAEVAQLLVGGEGFPYHVAELSSGSSQHYVVTPADEFGNPFSESGRGVSLLVLDTNRADIVSAKVSECEHRETTCNLTINLQALRQGTALVRVSIVGRPHVTDFILIKVGAFVNPRNPSLHVGGRINFTVVGKGAPKGERGHWTTDSPSVLHIDTRTGQATAVGEGTAKVKFIGSHLTTYTSATVIRVASVNIEVPVSSGQLTNVGQEEGYQFPVTFRDAQGYDIGIIGDNQEVSYTCRTEPSFLGYAVPWREPSSTTFFCVFFPFAPTDIYRLEENQKLVSSSGGSNGTMHFNVIAAVPSDPPVVGSVEVTMVGGFSVVNTPAQLHLSPTTNRSLITVIGNSEQLEVSCARTDVMMVKRISGPSRGGIADRVVYEVKLSAEDQRFTDQILFSLPAAGQKEERITVTYNADIHTASLLARPILTAIVLVVALLLLPLILCARILDLPRPPPEALVDRPEPAADVPLVSPGERTPPPIRSTFHHTSPPQPYTDYISRTIEKTPYYRRDGIRRFDPSRTY